MRVLFFNGLNITPHLETELEIAKDLIHDGHEVFFVQCRGELGTCYANPDHSNWICRNCSKRKFRALSLLGIDQSHILHFPEIKTFDPSIPKTFETVTDLKNFVYEGVDIGLGVASSFISITSDHKLDTKKYEKEIQTGVRTALFVYEGAKILLNEVKPDLVIFFNGRFLEIRPFMRLCEQNCIDYFTHERGGVMTTYLLRKNSTPHALNITSKEIIELWGSGGIEKEKKGEKFFVDRRNRIVQAWYVFTEGQEKGRLPKDFDLSKKNVVIFNSSIDEYEGIAGFSNKIYTDDNAGIRRIVESFKEDKNVHFYLRVHPNLSGKLNSQIKEIVAIGKAFSNLTVIDPDESIDSYAMVDAASVVMVFNSTVGAEACFWNKPVIVLGNSLYSFLDGFYKPTNHEEVVDLLNRNLKPLGNKDILKYGYWELSKGAPYKYYMPSTLTTGTFLGEQVNISLFNKMLSLLSI